MRRVMVLGAGLIGSFVTNELQKDKTLEVAVVDVNDDNLKKCKTQHRYKADLNDDDVLNSVLRNEDIIVNAMPGFMGYRILKMCIEHKLTVVDFSFMPEDFLELDILAKKNNVCVVADFGFAPGLSHLFAGYHYHHEFNKDIDTCSIWVGGLPLDKSADYKAVFSPVDIVEEYTRPARVIRNGEEVVEEPFMLNYLYHNDKLNLKTSGFVSDGLRSLLVTLPIKNMYEITLRYDKHFNYIRMLKENEYFSPNNLEKTVKMLTNEWKMTSAYRDMSVLEIISKNENKKIKTIVYDEHDGTNHSMARVTGLPAVAMVKLIAKKKFKAHGVHVPEIIGKNKKLVKYVIDFLRNYGIRIEMN